MSRTRGRLVESETATMSRRIHLFQMDPELEARQLTRKGWLSRRNLGSPSEGVCALFLHHRPSRKRSSTQTHLPTSTQPPPLTLQKQLAPSPNQARLYSPRPWGEQRLRWTSDPSFRWARRQWTARRNLRGPVLCSPQRLMLLLLLGQTIDQSPA